MKLFTSYDWRNLIISGENIHRGGSRAAAKSKMERFVIIVNGFQPLTIITKHSILDVAAALDPPDSLSGLWCYIEKKKLKQKNKILHHFKI